jgi:hypothetical protein
MEELSMLVALNLGFNPLQTFPTVMRGLTSLIELNIDSTGNGRCSWHCWQAAFQARSQVTGKLHAAASKWAAFFL